MGGSGVAHRGNGTTTVSYPSGFEISGGSVFMKLQPAGPTSRAAISERRSEEKYLVNILLG